MSAADILAKLYILADALEWSDVCGDYYYERGQLSSATFALIRVVPWQDRKPLVALERVTAQDFLAAMRACRDELEQVVPDTNYDLVTAALGPALHGVSCAIAMFVRTRSRWRNDPARQILFFEGRAR